MSITVEQLDLPPRIIKAAKNSKCKDVRELILFSISDIIRQLKLSSSDAKLLLKTVSSQLVTCHPVTALELYNGKETDAFQVCKLTTGCPILDGFLGGGISSVGITEIVGESSSGKTQFCLQLALTTQLPLDLGGLGKSVVFICTESAFCSPRLVEIVRKFTNKYGSKINDLNFGDNIYVSQIRDLDSLSTCINNHLPKIIPSKNVGTIIIDSIAALVRSEYDHTQNIAKSRMLQKLGVSLKNLISKHGVIVCCVNQMTANLNNAYESPAISSDSSISPALGLTWANIISTRLMLTRSSRCVQIGNRYSVSNKKTAQPVYSVIRFIDVCFSPYLPNRRSHFIVNAYGIQGIQL